MRFRALHDMTPGQRLGVLEAQFPPGSRAALFTQLVPGEYERLLRGVPASATKRWSTSHTAEDRKAWKAYTQRTQAQEAKEAAILAVLRPAMAKVLLDHPYDLHSLLSLPRLLGDPVGQAGVRLYWRREALGGSQGVFERTYSLDALVDSVAKLQLWGAAPFVAIQGIPYGMQRVNANVSEARVFSCDWDSKHGQSPPFDLLAEYPPDLMVRTGGGYHAYWAIPPGERTLSLTEWRRVALALCRTLNADEDAVLGAQLMRLPGSIHLKDYSNPRPVYVFSEYEGVPRSNIAAGLLKAFKLKPRDEDTFNATRASRSIDVDPQEHPALACLLDELSSQGLCPTPTNRGWEFYCPVHEVDRVFGADLEDGTGQTCIPRTNSTPSGVLRVNEDQSLAFFCGSTQRCGAGPRDLLEVLGLSTDLTWLECGGFLNSDYGKRWKAARIADGTWRGNSAKPKPVEEISDATRDGWANLEGV